MKNSTKIAAIMFCSTIVGLIIILIIKNQKLSTEINKLRVDQLRLQKFLFNKYGNSNSVVNAEIGRLMKQFKGFPETLNSLQRAKELYNQGHYEESVRKLVVIIENKLKYQLEQTNDSWFTSLCNRRKQFAKFDELINRAKELDWINDLQMSIAFTSVKIRHSESHQEGFKDEATRSHICILGCIEFIGILSSSNSVKLSPVSNN